MFSEYCDAPFEVEAAEVVTPSGETILYPSLAYRTETINQSKVNKLVGKSFPLSIVKSMGVQQFVLIEFVSDISNCVDCLYLK